MYDEKTGSPEKKVNKFDLKHTAKMFLYSFAPIFFTQILVNIERIKELLIGYITGANLPEIVELMIVPGVIALFVLIKQYLNDNAK